MNFQAAIFDMDGLLLDTERLCMQVFEQACANVNLPFYPDVYLSIIGQNAVSIDKTFRKVYHDDLDKLDAEWRKNYKAIVNHQAIPVKEGVLDLLKWLKANKIPTAVATSSQREVATVKLKLAGLDQYFDSLTCGCEVTQGKPDPEIYLLAAQRLGVEAAQCVAFEDSNNGVRSSMAANMTTFQIPDLVAPCEEVLALGHYVESSLSDALARLKTETMVA